MVTEPPKPNTSTPNAIEDSLGRARLDSAGFMNFVRFNLGFAFLILYAIATYGLKIDMFRATAGLIAGYSVMAGILWIFARRNDGVLNLSRFAVPLFDIPMATIVQWVNINHAQDDSDGITMYTLSIIIFLTVMSSFSIRRPHLIACAVIGTACILFLINKAEMTNVSYFSAPLMIFATVLGMGFMARRQTNLIRDAAERKARRDRLARHFSPGVAELIESHDDTGKGETCALTVLFCDIRGFTALSESIETQEVITLLNEFHGTMVDVIFRYGGTLDKYLGDGLLAYFNAPSRQKDHAERGVRCALAMIEDLAQLNERRHSNGGEPIRIGIGLHSGQAIVGEIGATHRREFTAIGDTVNVGNRIEQLTKDHESDILVSEAVRDQVMALTDQIKFESAGTTGVRGRAQSIEIFVPSNY